MVDETLLKWGTSTSDLEINLESKMLNARCYLFPSINKDTFCKELLRLFEIGVLTPIQMLDYGNPIFIIPNK